MRPVKFPLKPHLSDLAACVAAVVQVFLSEALTRECDTGAVNGSARPRRGKRKTNVVRESVDEYHTANPVLIDPGKLIKSSACPFCTKRRVVPLSAAALVLV